MLLLLLLLLLLFLTPSCMQALSAKFRNRLKIAVVSKSDKTLAKMLNVTAFPALRVLPAGSSSKSTEAVHYTGKVSLFAIDLFLMDFAKPAASGDSADAPKQQAQGGKTAKGKDAPKDKAKEEKAAPKDKAKEEKAAGGKDRSKSGGAEKPAGGKKADKKRRTGNRRKKRRLLRKTRQARSRRRARSSSLLCLLCTAGRPRKRGGKGGKANCNGVDGRQLKTKYRVNDCALLLRFHT
jgi:hypothetical protein